TSKWRVSIVFFFFQAEDGIRDRNVTGVQTCALPILVLRNEKREAKLVVFSTEADEEEKKFAERIEKMLKRDPQDVAPVRAKPLRSEEHTSELQSRFDLVCRLLLEKKKRDHEKEKVMI